MQGAKRMRKKLILSMLAASFLFSSTLISSSEKVYAAETILPGFDYYYKGSSYANLYMKGSSNDNSNKTADSTVVMSAKALYQPERGIGYESITAWSRLSTINNIYSGLSYSDAKVNQIDVKFRVQNLGIPFDIYSTDPKEELTEHKVNPYLEGSLSSLVNVLAYKYPITSAVYTPFQMVLNNINVKKGTNLTGSGGTVQTVQFLLPDSSKADLPISISYKEADYKTRKGGGLERGVTVKFIYDMPKNYQNIIVVPQAKVKYSVVMVAGNAAPVTLYGWTNTAYVEHTVNSK